jgi:hypothetical protein
VQADARFQEDRAAEKFPRRDHHRAAARRGCGVDGFLDRGGIERRAIADGAVVGDRKTLCCVGRGMGQRGA